MRALSSRPFCPCGGRRGGPGCFFAVGRYTARIRVAMTMINLACRLPQIRWPTRRGSFVRENPGTPCRPLGTTRRTNVEDSLWTRPDIGPTPCGVLGEALLEPDLLQRNHSPAQETDLHPLHVGLI